jgi:hypothetical protein
MSKFTFICEETYINIPCVRTVEFPAVLLEDIVKEFELFLKGCGFEIDGHLDFVNDE